MMGRQFWMGVAAGAVVLGAVGGGYLLGRDGAGTGAGGPAGLDATEAPHAAITGAGGAAKQDIPLRDYDQFRVGNRNVKAMAADGPVMWFGTSGGVIRYDTRTDEHKIYDNKSGLLSNGVFHLHVEGNEVWVGTYGGGLSILNTETGLWSNYNVPNGMGDAFVYDVMTADNGDVWIATWSGVNRIRGGNLDDVDAWDLYTVANTDGGLPNDWVYGLARGRDGEIWLATEGGVARFDGGEWQNWQHEDGLGAPYEVVKKQIDVTSDPGTASRHHAQQKQEQGLQNVSIAYNPNYVIAIHVDEDGSVWAGTWGGGLSVFRNGEWTTLTAADGLPSNHVFMLEKGPGGEIWIGTNRGMARYQDGTFERFTVHDGLVSENVFSMAFADDGSMWVGSFGGITHYRGGF